jgi:hypothetical protein
MLIHVSEGRVVRIILTQEEADALADYAVARTHEKVELAASRIKALQFGQNGGLFCLPDIVRKDRTELLVEDRELPAALNAALASR